MPKEEHEAIPENFETMAVEFADPQRFVLREVNRALEGMPEAQKKI